MQLKFERDFFIRPARGSDQKECLILIQKYHSGQVYEDISARFMSFLEKPDLFFKVLLNSNGMLIGVCIAHQTQILTLAINVNFLRREVRDEISRELKDWAKAQNAGKISVPRELIAGDWKRYFKQKGVKIESSVKSDPKGTSIKILEFT